ncbi:MAG TPA: hypothetical protein VFG14_01915 [Chthoniobacteraceae bacterium]|nr:hypothetical protein [Chthoniobacteraceae bacterium]
MRYFKGKWYGHVLQEHLAVQNKPADANFNGVWERLAATLVAQVAQRSGCKCCGHYETRIAALSAGM